MDLSSLWSKSHVAFLLVLDLYGTYMLCIKCYLVTGRFATMAPWLRAPQGTWVMSSILNAHIWMAFNVALQSVLMMCTVHVPTRTLVWHKDLKAICILILATCTETNSSL